MEDSEEPNLNSEIDLFALHCIFLPEVQQQLDTFKRRMELLQDANRTQQDSCTVMDTRCNRMQQWNDWNSCGIDWNGPVSTDRDDRVTVPEFANKLTTPLVVHYLQQHLNGVVGDNVLHYLVARGTLMNLLTLWPVAHLTLFSTGSHVMACVTSAIGFTLRCLVSFYTVLNSLQTYTKYTVATRPGAHLPQLRVQTPFNYVTHAVTTIYIHGRHNGSKIDT